MLERLAFFSLRQLHSTYLFNVMSLASSKRNDHFKFGSYCIGRCDNFSIQLLNVQAETDWDTPFSRRKHWKCLKDIKVSNAKTSCRQ